MGCLFAKDSTTSRDLRRTIPLAGFRAFHLSGRKEAALALPQLLPGVCQQIGNGISPSRLKVTLISGYTVWISFAHIDCIPAQSATETAKPRIALPAPESPTHSPWVIETIFGGKIYIRWGCIDFLSSHLRGGEQ